MVKLKFYWNLIRNSRKDKIKFKSDEIVHEIDQKSQLFKPLYFLVYTMQRLYLRVYMFVIILTGLSFRDVYWLSAGITLLVIIACNFVLPLVIIPKDFKRYLVLDDN